MKRKPRWTLEMLTASLAVLCGLLLLALLVQRPMAWPLLAVLVVLWGIGATLFRCKLRSWVVRWTSGTTFEKSKVQFSLEPLSQPAALLSGETVLWYNSQFRTRLLGGQDVLASRVQKLLPGLDLQLCRKREGQLLTLADGYWSVHSSTVPGEAESMTLLVLNEETEHILAGAHAHLLGLFKGGLPLDVGVGVLEVVVVAVPARLCKVRAQLAVGQRGGVQAGVHAGLVQRHSVKRRKDADIRQDGCIVLAVAVAVGADVLHQRNVEAGTVVADCGGILGHLAVQQLVGAVVGGIDGVKAARADAAAAALALVVVDDRLVFGIVSNGVRVPCSCLPSYIKV